MSKKPIDFASKDLRPPPTAVNDAARKALEQFHTEGQDPLIQSELLLGHKKNLEAVRNRERTVSMCDPDKIVVHGRGCWNTAIDHKTGNRTIWEGPARRHGVYVIMRKVSHNPQLGFKHYYELVLIGLKGEPKFLIYNTHCATFLSLGSAQDGAYNDFRCRHDRQSIPVLTIPQMPEWEHTDPDWRAWCKRAVHPFTNLFYRVK